MDIRFFTFVFHVYDQGDHLPGKPGIVREFKNGQGKVRENEQSQGMVREFKSYGKKSGKKSSHKCLDVVFLY